MAILTISFSERKAGPYTATAGQTVFFFGVPILANADLDVWRKRDGAATLLTQGIDYTVTGVAEPAGGQAQDHLLRRVACSACRIAARVP